MKKIISWNVASVRARLPVLGRLLEEYNPDIVLLQETKTTEEQFPFLDMAGFGYKVALSPQKAYNGVAVLSKEPMTDVKTSFPNMPLEEARFVETHLSDGTIVISVYVPNGASPAKDPLNPERLNYKLAWFEALNAYIKSLLDKGEKVVLGGDFNVIYQDGDVYNPSVFEGSPLMVEPVRACFDKLSSLSLINSVRHFNKESGLYSFWDFQGGAWFKNNGILLDTIFVSENMAGKLQSAEILKEVRGWEKTSDHAPVLCVLE